MNELKVFNPPFLLNFDHHLSTCIIDSTKDNKGTAALYDLFCNIHNAKHSIEPEKKKFNTSSLDITTISDQMVTAALENLLKYYTQTDIDRLLHKFLVDHFNICPQFYSCNKEGIAIVSRKNATELLLTPDRMHIDTKIVIMMIWLCSITDLLYITGISSIKNIRLKSSLFWKRSYSIQNNGTAGEETELLLSFKSKREYLNVKSRCNVNQSNIGMELKDTEMGHVRYDWLKRKQ